MNEKNKIFNSYFYSSFLHTKNILILNLYKVETSTIHVNSKFQAIYMPHRWTGKPCGKPKSNQALCKPLSIFFSQNPAPFQWWTGGEQTVVDLDQVPNLGPYSIFSWLRYIILGMAPWQWIFVESQPKEMVFSLFYTFFQLTIE